MAVFQYHGFQENGKGVSGTIEAPTEKAALDLLEDEGIIPARLKAQETASTGVRKKTRSLPWARVPMATRMLFVRELATFIHADVPLLEALGVLRQQETNATFKTILDEVHDCVQSGESFSHALASHPRVFSPLLVSMVRVGETGGMLDKVLEQMAVWLEREDEINNEIRAALAYPLIIVLLGVMTVFIMLSYVLPKITSIFTGMEAELPLITRVLMASADFMGRYWWLALLLAAAGLLAVRRMLQTKKGRRLYDRLALIAPIFGTLTRQAAIARFARASAALLASGVPLLEALRVVRGLLGNVIMAEMIDQAIEHVTRGHSLARTLEESPYFPPSVVHLLGVGERTGRLGEMFERVAQAFERQTNNQIRVMLSLLSPLLIIGLAVMVAIIAISILLPIFKLNQIMK